MPTRADPDRPLRADARRNHDRIVAAAREVFARHGPDLSLDEIAHRAGVSPATLFRHFANREELVGAVINQRFADDVEPTIAEALAGNAPWAGLVAVIGATLQIGATSAPWRETMVMAREAGLIIKVANDRFYPALTELLARAQDDGTVRPDVTPSDLKPLMRMLRALVAGDDDIADSWSRYLSLMLRTTPAVQPGRSSKRSVEK